MINSRVNELSFSRHFVGNNGVVMLNEWVEEKIFAVEVPVWKSGNDRARFAFVDDDTFLNVVFCECQFK